MSYFPRALVEQVEERVTIRYVDKWRVKDWNERRPDGTLRLLTGWTWIEKTGQRRVRGGFKTYSVALRDAYYAVLVGLETAPGQDRRTSLQPGKPASAPGAAPQPEMEVA